MLFRSSLRTTRPSWGQELSRHVQNLLRRRLDDLLLLRDGRLGATGRCCKRANSKTRSAGSSPGRSRSSFGQGSSGGAFHHEFHLGNRRAPGVVDPLDSLPPSSHPRRPCYSADIKSLQQLHRDWPLGVVEHQSFQKGEARLGVQNVGNDARFFLIGKGQEVASVVKEDWFALSGRNAQKAGLVVQPGDGDFPRSEGVVQIGRASCRERV